MWVRGVVFTKLCQTGRVLLTSLKSLKRGSLAALVVLDSSIYKTSSASVIPSGRVIFISSSSSSSLAAFLYNNAKQKAWYFASSATRSPALNLASSFSSCSKDAHFRTWASRPRVETLWRGFLREQHSSHTKHVAALSRDAIEFEHVNFPPTACSYSSGHLFSAHLSLN